MPMALQRPWRPSPHAPGSRVRRPLRRGDIYPGFACVRAALWGGRRVVRPVSQRLNGRCKTSCWVSESGSARITLAGRIHCPSSQRVQQLWEPSRSPRAGEGGRELRRLREGTEAAAKGTETRGHLKMGKFCAPKDRTRWRGSPQYRRK